MGFFVGFADEIEKLALRLPSMGEMTSGFGSEPNPEPSAVAQPAPAPVPQGQSVHVHVHHQAKKTAPAPAPAAPKTTLKGLEMPSTDAPSSSGLPDMPGFGGPTGKAAPKTYEATGPTSGKHTAPKGISVGKPAAAGTQLPSQMNSGPRWIEDTGNGPTRDAVMTPKDLMSGISQASRPGIMAPGVDKGTTSQGPDSTYSGLQYGKGPAPSASSPAPASKENEFSTGRQAFTGLELPRASTPAPTPKKKMFGTALASNE